MQLSTRRMWTTQNFTIFLTPARKGRGRRPTAGSHHHAIMRNYAKFSGGEKCGLGRGHLDYLFRGSILGLFSTLSTLGAAHCGTTPMTRVQRGWLSLH